MLLCDGEWMQLAKSEQAITRVWESRCMLYRLKGERTLFDT